MSSILAVECDKLIAQVLRENLKPEGCYVDTISWCPEAIQCALREIPSLVIIDISLLGADCYPVIQRLRNHPKCMHIPIIVISSRSSLSEKIHAYEVGVDSYLTKPLNTDELLAHIRRQLRRLQQSTLSPLTHLPGGTQLECALDTRIRSQEPWSILYLDLNNFKAFNDVYGFLAGNDMILLLSTICQQVVCEFGNVDDFVGHIGGDDFVIVTTPDREKLLCDQILTRYKNESRSLYRCEDLARDSIIGIDRKSPLVTLAIGVVSDRFHCSRAIDEIGSLTAEAKRRAKRSSNNISHISIDWRYSLREPVSVSHSAYSAHPAQSLNVLDRFPHKLFHTSDEDALARLNR